jgi:hypothetical protein
MQHILSGQNVLHDATPTSSLDRENDQDIFALSSDNEEEKHSQMDSLWSSPSHPVDSDLSPTDTDSLLTDPTTIYSSSSSSRSSSPHTSCHVSEISSLPSSSSSSPIPHTLSSPMANQSIEQQPMNHHRNRSVNTLTLPSIDLHSPLCNKHPLTTKSTPLYPHSSTSSRDNIRSPLTIHQVIHCIHLHTQH